MKNKKSQSLSLPVSLLSLLCLLSACSMGNQETPVVSAPEIISGPVYTRLSLSPPPEPQVEPAPMLQDNVRQAWRPGYWDYDGGHFNWVSGEVLDKPALTAIWQSDHWEKREYGWALVPGKWQ